MKTQWMVVITLLAMGLSVPAAQAAKLRDSVELNAYAGNGLTLIASYTIDHDGEEEVVDNSATSNESLMVQIPRDARNFQIIGVSDASVGEKFASFQDRQPLQLLMTNALRPQWQVLDEQSKDKQKNKKGENKYIQVLSASISAEELVVNALKIFRFNHKFNASAPTLLVRKMPYTYKEMVSRQIAAQQALSAAQVRQMGVPEVPTEQQVAPVPGDEPFDRQPYRPGARRPSQAQPEIDPQQGGASRQAPREVTPAPLGYDPRAEQNGGGQNAAPTSAPRRQGPRTTNPGGTQVVQRDPIRNDSGRQDARDPREMRDPRPQYTPEPDPRDNGRRPSSRPSVGGPADKRTEMGKALIKLMRSGEPAEFEPLDIDIYIDGRFYRGITVTAADDDEKLVMVPPGIVELWLSGEDRRRWKLDHFRGSKVTGGQITTITIRER